MPLQLSLLKAGKTVEVYGRMGCAILRLLLVPIGLCYGLPVPEEKYEFPCHMAPAGATMGGNGTSDLSEEGVLWALPSWTVMCPVVDVGSEVCRRLLRT